MIKGAGIPDQLLNISRLETGEVVGSETINGNDYFLVRSDNIAIHDRETPAEQCTRCTALKLLITGSELSEESRAFEEGTQVLVVFKHVGKYDEGYIIGAIQRTFTSNKMPITQGTGKGGFALYGEQGAGFSVSNKKDQVILSTPISKIDVRNAGVSIANGPSTIGVSKTGLNILYAKNILEEYGSIKISNSQLHIKSKGRVLIGAENGGVKILGVGLQVNTSGPSLIKSNGMQISSGAGLMNFSSGTFKQVITGNFATLGFSDAWQIKIAKGNAILDVASGDVSIITSNLLFTDKVTIRCGTSIPGIPKSDIVLSGTSLKLTNVSAGPIKCSISMSVGFTNIDSFFGINIDTKLLKVSGKLVDFSSSDVINLGPKFVLPSPTGGPFCAIKNCLLTGAPHQGPIAK